jgi:hypothetical protein
LENEHVVENDVKELVQLVDFKEWYYEEETNVVENDALEVV